MSAASGNSAAAPSLRRLPFTVCVAPSFANPLVNVTANEPISTASQGGLLFGVRDSGSVVVRHAYAFDLRTGTNGSSQALEAAVAAAISDAHLKTLSLVGWYAQRPTGGLRESDIEFHNRNFLKVSDLAIVVRPEGVSEIVCEIYSRSIEGLLSEEGHRWGLLRLTRQKLLEESAEVTMRAQMRDDFFMRAYQQPYDASGEDAQGMWKRTLGRLFRGPKEQAAKEPGISAATVSPEPPKEIVQRSAPPLPERLSRDQVRPEPLHNKDQSKPEPTISKDRASLDPVISRDRAPLDPANDLTREMPREIALKALGLDLKASEPVQSIEVPEKQLTATQAPAPAAAPAKEIALRHDLSPITAERTAPAARTRIPAWMMAAVIFGVAAAATFAVVHYHLFPNGGVSTNGAASTLGLRLEGQGDRILVTWDRKGASALAAISGQLAIDDGAQHKTLMLDPSQIVNGSVLYRPNSADITFHLQMTSRDGRQTDETLRVLDASRTNNDGIKVMTLDGVAEPLPAALPKPAMTRKSGATTLSPGKAVVATDLNAGPTNEPRQDKTITQPGDELPPQPSSPKEAPSTTDTGGSASGANPTTTASSNQQPTEGPSETVLAPVAVKDTSKVAESLGSGGPVVPIAAAKAVETPAAQANPLRSYRAPQPTRQVMPNIRALPPGLASSNGQVEVTVSIDQQGHVKSARITNNSGKVNSALTSAVLSAARAWNFNPAMLNGQAIDSEHAIVFNFKAAER